MVQLVRPKIEKVKLKARRNGKGIVIFSGGIDSTTLLYDLKSQGYTLYPITFYYGQRHSREVESAERICESLGLETKVVNLEALSEVAPSALTREGINIPQAEYDEETMQTTVVPNRNMVFVALATSYAISMSADRVFIGAHSGDHYLYPDCRPLFFDALAKAVWICDYYNVSLEAPYLYWHKTDILRRGLGLGVDYSLTWSCYKGGVEACGRCGTCRERLEAFQQVGASDPLSYEEV